MTHADPSEWPHALLLLGDQVYADEVHPHIEDELDGDGFVESYDDYVRLYTAAWGEPVIRWLLSTVPERDDLRRPRRPRRLEHVDRVGHRDAPEGRGGGARIVAAFESYLIYQHLGNLSPSERADFELYEHLRTAEDPTPRLREFAKQADEEVEGTRWSFCRDIGPARVVMIDSRAGRVLDPGNRSMVDPDEWRWIEEHACGDVQHLLIGTSLPMFMGPAMHWLEAWNEVVADGAWGKPVKKVAEKLRQELDLEHWPAWQASFRRMCDLLIEVGAGRRGEAPSTICVAQRRRPPRLPGRGRLPAGHAACKSAVWQAVCSPFRNPLDANERRVILACWTRAAGLVTRALARRAGVADPPVRWRLAHEKPWFNNQVAMLELEGAPRHVRAREGARRRRTGRASPCWSGYSSVRSNPTPTTHGLKTHSPRWGHDLVANRLEPLRTT